MDSTHQPQLLEDGSTGLPSTKTTLTNWIILYRYRGLTQHQHFCFCSTTTMAMAQKGIPKAEKEIEDEKKIVAKLSTHPMDACFQAIHGLCKLMFAPHKQNNTRANHLNFVRSNRNKASGKSTWELVMTWSKCPLFLHYFHHHHGHAPLPLQYEPITSTI